ncbi:protein FAM19A5-like [Arapaima gigas]
MQAGVRTFCAGSGASLCCLLLLWLIYSQLLKEGNPPVLGCRASLTEQPNMELSTDTHLAQLRKEGRKEGRKAGTTIEGQNDFWNRAFQTGELQMGPFVLLVGLTQSLLAKQGSFGQLAVGTCEIVMLNRDSSQPRRTIARQTARCACRRGQIAGTTRARPACVDARIVKTRQWCEMAPCSEGEVCGLLFNRSGWTCTRGGGRIKTVTVRAMATTVITGERDKDGASRCRRSRLKGLGAPRGGLTSAVEREDQTSFTGKSVSSPFTCPSAQTPHLAT